MIIKFDEYINEDLLYTDSIQLNSDLLPIIQFDEGTFTKTIDVTIENLKQIKNNTNYQNYNDIINYKLFVKNLFPYVKNFIADVIAPYFRKLNIGIKNIIPIKLYTNGVYYPPIELNYDLRVSKNIIEIIIKKVENDTLDFVDQENKESLIFMLKLKDKIHGIISYLKYKIINVDGKKYYWTEDFINYAKQFPELTELSQYIKKENEDDN